MEQKEKREKILLSSEKAAKRAKRMKALRLGLLVNILFLTAVYFILKILYQQGAFTVSLNQKFAKEAGVIIFENVKTKQSRRVLEAEKLEFMDNISEKWLPNNLHEASDGSHNGDNYIAYTFYVENLGAETVNYWTTIYIDDVIKNVDEAIRVRVYKNDEVTTYAKLNSNGKSEDGTVPFNSDKYVMLEQRKGFKVEDIDKYTIVIWIEGDDPDCVDALIGGEMKMHLEIDEEHIQTTEN